MEARLAKVEAAVEHIQTDVATIKIELREFRGEILKLRGDLGADIREVRNHARDDFRILFGATIVSTLGLAALMAKGFHWL